MRDDPRTLGKALVGNEFGGLWRYRVQDYRVVCELQDEKVVVLVLKIGRRDKVYS